jgi:hypothetical protein
MNELQIKIGSSIQATTNGAALPDLRIVGYPIAFTAWGVALVRQILESAGYAVKVVQLGQMPPDPEVVADDTAGTVRIMFGYGPVMTETDLIPDRPRQTIVFLDTPANVMHELLAGGCDPMEAARFMTATLAPLASILREEKVLLLDRSSAEDLPAMQTAIAAYLSPVLPLPAEAAPVGAAIGAGPVPSLVGQALSLTRQMLVPLANIVTGAPHATIVWPLACFYAGDHPNELAPPIVDVVGPARSLYYGPYFYLPRGGWRADIQMFLTRNLPDTTFGVDVAAGTDLVRRKFRPADDGLCELSVPFVIERTEDRIELRIWLLRSAMEGHIGLRQVLLHPVEPGTAGA